MDGIVIELDLDAETIVVGGEPLVAFGTASVPSAFSEKSEYRRAGTEEVVDPEATHEGRLRAVLQFVGPARV